MARLNEITLCAELHMSPEELERTDFEKVSDWLQIFQMRATKAESDRKQLEAPR